MTEMLAEMQKLSENFTDKQFENVITYMKFIKAQPTPLDDFDYELARRADEDTCTETISLEELAESLGIDYESL